jgi:DNA-binding transcriptional LysR family regulator
MTNFDWALMRSFLAVMDEGSLQAAARKLSSTQPTIGRHMAELEQQLGAVLFERAGTSLRPTHTATLVAEQARQMSQGADAVARAVASRSEELTGTVRVAASEVVACYAMPQLLAKLRQQAPGISIELVASNQASNLLRRDADIAVRMFRPTQTNLVAKKIAEVGVAAYAHTSYVKRRGAPATPMDLLKHELVGYDREDTIIKGFRSYKLAIRPENFALRTDDHRTYFEAVRAGLGIGFLSHFTALRDKQLVHLLPELVIKPLPVWLTVHREIRHSKRIRQVYDFIADYISAELATS